MKVFVVELPNVIYIGLYALNFVFINGDSLYIILKKKGECEAGSNSWLWFQLNGATKLHDNLPGYYKAQTNSIGVHTSTLIDHSKRLEKVLLVLLWDTDAAVCNLDGEELLILAFFFNFDDYLHLSILGELKGIGLKA